MFPRKNLISASKRLKNLGEILSPTVQTTRQGIGGGGGPATGMDVEGRVGGGRGQGRGGARARGRGGARASSQGLNVKQPPGGPTNSGSYHCQYQLKSGKCDVCGRMSESRSVLSSHFGVRHKKAGYNVQLPASQAKKYRWFINLEECVYPVCWVDRLNDSPMVKYKIKKTSSLARNPQLKAGTGLEKTLKGWKLTI